MNTNRFSETRLRLGISREQFSELLGVSMSTANQWESGRREPPAVAFRMLDILQMIEIMAPAVHQSLIPPPKRGKLPGPKPRQPVDQVE